jgi:hypothetical protein
MKLFLDHLYCSLPSAVFSELQAFFKPVVSTDSYWVNSNHGKWHGIYAFPKFGGFLEFLEETQRDPAGTHGIAFSQHGEETKLAEYLENLIPGQSWIHTDRNKSDGSLYYKSSYVENQDPHLFLWGMDYFGENGRKIRSKGELPENPILSLKSLSIELPENTFKLADTQLLALAKLESSTAHEKKFSIFQKNTSDLLLTLRPSPGPSPHFELQMEVLSKFNGDFSAINLAKAKIQNQTLTLSC